MKINEKAQSKAEINYDSESNTFMRYEQDEIPRKIIWETQTSKAEALTLT